MLNTVEQVPVWNSELLGGRKHFLSQGAKYLYVTVTLRLTFHKPKAPHCKLCMQAFTIGFSCPVLGPHRIIVIPSGSNTPAAPNVEMLTHAEICGPCAYAGGKSWGDWLEQDCKTEQQCKINCSEKDNTVSSKLLQGWLNQNERSFLL